MQMLVDITIVDSGEVAEEEGHEEVEDDEVGDEDDGEEVLRRRQDNISQKNSNAFTLLWSLNRFNST